MSVSLTDHTALDVFCKIGKLLNIILSAARGSRTCANDGNDFFYKSCDLNLTKVGRL